MALSVESYSELRPVLADTSKFSDVALAESIGDLEEIHRDALNKNLGRLAAQTSQLLGYYLFEAGMRNRDPIDKIAQLIEPYASPILDYESVGGFETVAVAE
jgi:hypothetical protein